MRAQPVDIERKTSLATKWSLFGEIAAKLISPISNMVLARVLTPEAFGVVATVSMVVSFADVFTDAGFQKYLVQHDFQSKEDLYRGTTVAFWTNLLVSCLLWAGIFVLRDALAQLVGSPGLGVVIAVAALSLPLTSFSSIQMALFRRDFDFRTLFKVRVTVALVPLVVTVPLALATHSYWALVAGTLCGNLANAALLTLWSSWKPALYYSLQTLQEMFSYSWWILLESIAVWATSYADTLIVGLYLDEYHLGIYKTSMVTVNAIFALITSATGAPLFSALSRLKDDDASLKETYLRFIRSIGTFVIPLGMGMWLYRDAVVAILLGPQWTDAALFVGLWGLTSSFSLVLGTYCNGVYNAIGKTKLSLLSQVLHLVVLIPVVFFSSRLGFVELCVARSLVRLELVVVQLILMRAFVGIVPTESLRNLKEVFLCSAVMVGFGISFGWLVGGVLGTTVGIAGCVLIYFAAMHAFSPGGMREALSAFGLRLTKRASESE